jgi:uncharacterized protein YbjT (DUF2867 family)
MTTTKPKVLAVGAAGKFASLVVPELVRRGASVRGLIRDPKQSEEVRKRGASEVVVGDLRDRASLDKALAGIESVFYIAPAFLASEAEVGRVMVAAAKQAGVRRFVFSSVIHPVISALANHIGKAPVEEAIIESEMEYALLQPAMFFQNIAAAWPGVLQTGVYAEPWSARTRFSRVDYRDVAEVAAIALTEDRLNYGTYQLCAEGDHDRHGVAALMSEVMARDIVAGSIDPDKAAGGQPPAIKQMFDWYDHHGLLGNALTLRAILGREPRTLDAYFQELMAANHDA